MIAGASLTRSVVELPAWKRAGAAAWAQYIRKADLRNGLFWYPALAVGGAVFTALAAVERRSLWPSAAFASAGVLTTIRAAPNLIRIRDNDRPDVVAKSFERFRYWQNIRAVVQGVAFVSAMFAIAELRGSQAR